MDKSKLNIAPEKITVAAGIIYNSQSEILIAKRPSGKPSAGLWEFPGGKVEAGELPAEALCRELFEELAITPTKYSFLLTLQHTYGTREVSLFIFEVDDFEGEPRAVEQQELCWVKKQDLPLYPFLAGNKKIIELLSQSASLK